MKEEKQHEALNLAQQVFRWTVFLIFGLRHSGLPRLKRRYLCVLYSLQFVSWVILLLFCVKPLVLFDGIDAVFDPLHGMQSHFVEVSGLRVHYLAAGPVDGQPVVLVHGLGGIAEDWTGLQGYLTHAGFRVYMPELIGYGRSEKPADYTYSVRSEAYMITGFLDALGLKQVDLAGWSMGGWIVQLVASDHPERVRRLILFDSGGLREKPLWDTRLFTPTTPSEFTQFLALLMPHPPRLPVAADWVILHIWKDKNWVKRRSMASLLTGEDATDERLPALKMPVLIVWGDMDRIFPLSQGKRIHQLVPQSEFEVIAGCGHMAPVQCTAQIGPKVVAFVDR